MIKAICISLLIIFGSLAQAADLRLHQAAAAGDVIQVRKLLKEKVDVNALDSGGYPAFYHALDNDNEKLALELLKASMNLDLKVGIGKESLLVMSIYKSAESCIQYIIKKDSKQVKNVGEDGFTPLMIAARMSNLKVSKILVAAGADFKLKNKFGKTALDLAIKAQNHDVAEFLKKLK